MKTIAIFASGTGSNAEKIVRYFRDREDVAVGLIVSNRADARVLDMARQNHIPTLQISRSDFYESRLILDRLRESEIDLIVLAGFLWLVPAYLVQAYSDRIINIHPALLPAYGGKGMYGMHVHRAVKAAGEQTSGITIHLVNEKYDEGKILFQARCAILPDDTAEDIARKVLELEHRHFAEVIDQHLQKD